MKDQIEATEILHHPDDAELHFRFIGRAKNRQFAINVQFESADSKTSERLRPEELDFMMSNVLRLVLARIAETPNPALH